MQNVSGCHSRTIGSYFALCDSHVTLFAEEEQAELLDLCGGEPGSLPTNVWLPKWHELIVRHRQLKPRPSRPLAEGIIVKEPEPKTLIEPTERII
jgi:hypothetical protein